MDYGRNCWKCCHRVLLFLLPWILKSWQSCWMVLQPLEGWNLSFWIFREAISQPMDHKHASGDNQWSLALTFHKTLPAEAPTKLQSIAIGYRITSKSVKIKKVVFNWLTMLKTPPVHTCGNKVTISLFLFFYHVSGFCTWLPHLFTSSQWYFCRSSVSTSLPHIYHPDGISLQIFLKDSSCLIQVLHCSNYIRYLMT